MSFPPSTGAEHSGQGPIATVLATIRAMTAPPGQDQALANIVEAARPHTGARAAALWRCDPQNGELAMVVPAREPILRLQPGVGLVGRCAQTGTVLYTADAGSTGDIAVSLMGEAHDAHAGATLHLPLLAADGRVLGVLQLEHEQRAGFDAHAVLWAQVIANQCALALQRAPIDAAPDAASALHTEVEVARAIQRSTLPTTMPTVPGYDLYGHFQPATYAGGDMFDAVELPQGVFLLLGDATGHGFGPALSAMEMQGMLRVAFRLGANLNEAFRHVNNQLTEDLADDRFITAFMAFLDATTHELRYHCAGQGPLLHYHAANDQCDWLQPTTFPVGVMGLAAAPAAASLQLAPGDVLALISDGLYERTDASNTEFGPERVAAVVRGAHHLSMAELCQKLLVAAEDFAGGIAAADDVTLILVRRLPEPGAGR